MAKAGDIIENPVTGERMEFLKTARDTDGSLLQIAMTVRVGGFPVGGAPHIHLGQEERFQVLAGKMRVWLDGESRLLVAGEEITLPPGRPHYWVNAGESELRAIVELRPALRLEALFETLFGLARDGKTDAKGRPSLFQTAVIFDEYRLEVASASPADRALSVAVPLLAAVGRSLGHRPHYPEYAPSR